MMLSEEPILEEPRIWDKGVKWKQSPSVPALFRGQCGVWAAKGAFTISLLCAVCGEGLSLQPPW